MRTSVFTLSAVCNFLVASAFSVSKPLTTTCPLSRVSSARCDTALSAENGSSIKQLAYSMLKSSNFVYTYATIRKVVNEHDKLIREGVPATEKKFLGLRTVEKPMVSMYRPELVVTQRGAQEEDENKYLRYPITAAAVSLFLENNRNFLYQAPSGGDVSFQDVDKESADMDPLPVEDDMRDAQKYDGEIVDYDDQFTSEEGLVYGITINRSLKRLIVVFRGTVGGKDILTDANFFRTTPEVFKKAGLDVKVHSGFSSYLFNQIPGKDRTKFERIVSCLKDYFEEKIPENERDDYQICVSGHSLGGALCNLFSFALVATQGDYKYFQKVKAVSYAAPVVGNKDYNREYQKLEKEGKLMHLRISNENDLVPSQPVPGYTQNGVNIHSFDADKDEPSDLDYRNTKSVLTQLSLKPLTNHMFPEYEARLFRDINDDLLSKSFDELYETAGDFTN